MTTVENLFQMRPIGYMHSPFKFKNGTPRQPTVCSQARGFITIEKSIFNNPEHSMEGLEQFSHVWVLFVFHKNNNVYTKAKVKPPRLNGQKVGLFSTRSPYRPNAVGLTLARIDSVQGDTVYLSGIDLLDGTPILDIKPYIAQYDCPEKWPMSTRGHSTERTSANEEEERVAVRQNNESGTRFEIDNTDSDPETDLTAAQNTLVSPEPCHCETNIICSCGESRTDEGHLNFKDNSSVGASLSDCQSTSSLSGNIHYSEKSLSVSVQKDNRVTCISNELGNILVSAVENNSLLPDGSTVYSDSVPNAIDNSLPEMSSFRGDKPTSVTQQTADWIDKPPIHKLRVRFTESAEKQLSLFDRDSASVHYKLQFLHGKTEAKEAIENILCEDPRSIYRRKNCVDNLYYFTVDILHVTCWFDEGHVAEVIRVKPASLVEQCKNMF